MRDRAVRGLLVLLLICVTVLTIRSATADVKIVRTYPVPRLNGSLCDIILRGRVATADAAVLDASECVRVNIFIHDSPGGDADAAMHIGRWARERDARIAVGWDAYCYSSCALVFIGGVTRYNFGEIGLHRPYLAGEARSDAEVEALVSRMLNEIRDYVDEMGVRPELASVMIDTPPSTMRMYRRDEIYEIVAETDPTYDELQVAQNARRYGITTDEYRRRHAEAERNCVASRLGFSRYMELGSQESAAYSSAQLECEQAIYWGLSRSVYRNRYKNAVEHCKNSDLSSEEVQKCRIEVMQGLR